MRRALALQEFDALFCHRAGVQNTAADCLGREVSWGLPKVADVCDRNSIVRYINCLHLLVFVSSRVLVSVRRYQRRDGAPQKVPRSHYDVNILCGACHARRPSGSSPSSYIRGHVTT